MRLIRLLAAAGDRAAALSEYRTCVRVLSAELGVAPLPSTTALFDAIGAGEGTPRRDGARGRRGHCAARPGWDLPLVGRDAEWRRSCGRSGDAGPDGRVAVLEGEAGSARRAWRRPSSPAHGNGARPR